ncbi:MAG TPA: ATP-grasp domain-containing protein, partial [Spirochaetia bacterium]|nr:ATP-grasp domain-containing protein [Spirochaetia bacterium]
VVADGNTEAVGIPEAHRFAHVDLRDREGMTVLAEQIRAERGLDGVFTAGTDFSTTVAWVAQALGLPGIPYETALNATDKVRMRRLLNAHGVPQPAFRELGKSDLPLSVLEHLSLPLVIKPVDNMGARGVRKLQTEEDLVRAFAAALSFSASGRVIVEEYVPGPEFSLDALVADGEPVLTGFADRHIFFEPRFIEMGHTMPTAVDHAAAREVVEVFFKGIRALGISPGAAKGDVKLSPRGALVGEIAARLSGGYMSGWTYPYAHGVNLTAAALRLAVGEPLPDLSPREHDHSAERAVISIPGRVARITGVKEARRSAFVRDLFLRVNAGDPVVFPANNVEKCANVITKAPTRDQAIAAAQEAIAKLFIRLEPGGAETEAFLFTDKTAPRAFRLAVKQNQDFFDGLSGWYGDPGRLDPKKPAVLTLPGLAEEEARDWHGLSLPQAAAEVRAQTGLCFLNDPAGAPCVVGRLFWTALLAGSVPGAVWLLDTLAAQEDHERLTLFMKGKAS